MLCEKEKNTYYIYNNINDLIVNSILHSSSPMIMNIQGQHDYHSLVMFYF